MAMETLLMQVSSFLTSFQQKISVLFHFQVVGAEKLRSLKSPLVLSTSQVFCHDYTFSVIHALTYVEIRFFISIPTIGHHFHFKYHDTFVKFDMDHPHMHYDGTTSEDDHIPQPLNCSSLSYTATTALLLIHDATMQNRMHKTLMIMSVRVALLLYLKHSMQYQIVEYLRVPDFVGVNHR